MEIPETRYARRGDLHIGYQVWGGGEPDILDLGFGTYISIDEIAEQSQWLRYTERLMAFGRIIRFDPGGIGLSDTPANAEELTLDAWVDDALAVLNAADAGKVVVIAASGWTQPALQLAAGHPHRIAELVVINGSARYVEADDYPMGIPVKLMDEFRAGLDPDGSGQANDDLSDLRLFAPSSADDPEFRRWWSRGSKRGATPSTAATLNALLAQSDLRHLLPRISVPTLVLHRAEALAPIVDQGRYIADRIPGARFVELPGADVVPFLGNLEVLVDEIQEFVTGERYHPGAHRFLATILFSDIVASTDMAARLGDRRWTELLRDHDGLVRRQIHRFGGQFEKDTGDGYVATFDLPTHAIRCALALRDGADHLGLQVRTGLHTGEIERTEDDIRGIAVHVAARTAGVAAAGEVLVSGVVAELVEGSGIVFEDRGMHQLKGVPQSRRMWSAEHG